MVQGLQLPAPFRPRLAQMAREGVRHTAQAFQQMGPARRYAGLVATLRDLEATLTDAALDMFRSLVARANLRARKRLEDTVAASVEGGRERLLRIADVLDALRTTANRRWAVLARGVLPVAPNGQAACGLALAGRWLYSGGGKRPGPSLMKIRPIVWVLMVLLAILLVAIYVEGHGGDLFTQY